MFFYCFGVISLYLISFRLQIKLRSCIISSWKLTPLRWKWIPLVKPQKDKVTKTTTITTKRKKEMNVIVYANCELTCTKDSSSSLAFISFSNLISAVVSIAPVIQLNISGLEFVCYQMPGLKGSSFLLYLETSIHQHPFVFSGSFLLLQW